ncbi:MAG TPA: HAD family hydrolase, partial [Chromatiales bacterium]|nr:HAD family hydrolase [Chromatiales bacterium]
GLRLAIATTTTPANVSALLHYSAGKEAEGWFDVIAAGDIVPAKKPAPDIFVYALEQLGVSPASVIAFEDSAHGLRSARDAEIAAVVVSVNDYTQDQDFSDASLVVDQLGEPGESAKVLSGEENLEMVDVEALKRLHERVHVD